MGDLELKPAGSTLRTHAHAHTHGGEISSDYKPTAKVQSSDFPLDFVPSYTKRQAVQSIVSAFESQWCALIGNTYKLNRSISTTVTFGIHPLPPPSPPPPLSVPPPSPSPHLPPRVSDRELKDELTVLPSVSSLGAESTEVVRAKAPRIPACWGVVGRLLNPPAGRLIVKSSITSSSSSVLGIWSVVKE